MSYREPGRLIDRLHPLHSPQHVAEIVLQTGMYFDMRRRTGTTTAQALKALAEAIMNPFQEVTVRDHHGTPQATRNLLNLIRDIAERLELQHIHVSQASQSVIFENRDTYVPTAPSFAP